MSHARFNKKQPAEFYLLRDAARRGAQIDISEDGSTLIVDPENAVPDALRNQIFASERACIEALRQFQRSQAEFEELLKIAWSADAVGAKYFIFPLPGGDVELAIYSLYGPIQPWIWFDLMKRRDAIIVALQTLKVTRPVSVGEIVELIQNYDMREGMN